jgi:aryl-alcohol dehydrogenase
VRGLAVEVLKPKGHVALLTSDMETRSFSGGRKAFGVIQGDAVPQRFIPRLIDFYRVGRFPFDSLVKFSPFADINRAIPDAGKGDTIKPVPRMGTPP